MIVSKRAPVKKRRNKRFFPEHMFCKVCASNKVRTILFYTMPCYLVFSLITSH